MVRKGSLARNLVMAFVLAICTRPRQAGDPTFVSQIRPVSTLRERRCGYRVRVRMSSGRTVRRVKNGDYANCQDVYVVAVGSREMQCCLVDTGMTGSWSDGKRGGSRA